MTKNLELFNIAWNNMKERKLRAWLTMIGIFIGITAVVALISLGQGMQNAINEQFKMLGADKLTISPAGLQSHPGSDTGNAKLTESDYDIVKKTKGVKAVSYRLMKTVKVEANHRVKYKAVVGLPTDPESDEISVSMGFEVESGRSLKDGDKYKVLIGSEYATDDNEFKKAFTTKDSIIIAGEKYDIVGILDKMGNVLIDRAIVMQADHAKDVLGFDDELSVIVAQVENGEDTEVIADKIQKNMRKERGLEEGKEDFQIIIPTQIIETFSNIFNIVIYVIVGIAGISLVVGAVGIMNTMYTAILERKKEIGIMKSIGARNSDIFKIFLYESAILGLVGGIIGIILGYGLAGLIEKIVEIAWQPGFLVAQHPYWLPIGMLIFSLGVGTISGTFPAMQAANLHPVDALKK